jgi:hypothetical protein
MFRRLRGALTGIKEVAAFSHMPWVRVINLVDDGTERALHEPLVSRL